MSSQETPTPDLVMHGVREYTEEMPVTLARWVRSPRRWVVYMQTEHGNGLAELDLADLLGWLKQHSPEVLEETLK